MMFARIEFIQNASLNNVLSDIVAVLTGETDVNNLSAHSTPGSSEIITERTTSPWELWDDVSGSHKVIRCQQSDSGEWKYVGIHHQSDTLANAKYSLSCAYEWDKVLHTGTNYVGPEYAYRAVGNRQDQPSSGGYPPFTMYMYADEFSFYLLSQGNYGILGNSEGNTTLQYGGIGCWECDRINPSIQLGDMPNWFIGHGSALAGGSQPNVEEMNLSFPKGRNYNGTEITRLRSYGYVAARGNYNYQDVAYLLAKSVCPAVLSGPDQFPVEHLQVQGSGIEGAVNCQGVAYYGSISTRCNVWMINQSAGDAFTFVIFNGQKYMIWKAAHNAATTGYEVGHKFLVPYG